VPPAPSPRRRGRRPWSTRPSDCPGVKRVRRRWQARVAVRQEVLEDGRPVTKTRWLHLGSFATEFDARRAARRARELKRLGRLPRAA
jgi:hypothetical protein